MTQEASHISLSAGYAQSLLTDKEAAAYLNISPNTLAVWRCTKRYPIPFVRLGRAIRYKVADLDKWIEAQMDGGQQ